MDYPGIDGFLTTRASIMLDVVFVAMFAVIPVMGISIYLVKYRRMYGLHKKIQLALGIVLLLAVSLFEIDMQLVTDWRARAEPSRYYGSMVFPSLYVHLFFAVPTAVLWIFVIVQGMRKFPNPPRPNEYSTTHIRWAKLAALEMFMTAVTGWIFYWLAFVS